jgi:phage terminase small subunit
MPSIFVLKGGGIVAKMTEKQRRFCEEYLVDANATQAAIRAGYSAKTAQAIGAENLTKPVIKNFIRERMEAKQSKLIADQDEVLRYLTSVMRGESKASVLARQMTGEEKVIDKPPDEKERLKAAELLGKRYGVFTDKVDIDGVLPVTIVDDLK